MADIVVTQESINQVRRMTGVSVTEWSDVQIAEQIGLTADDDGTLRLKLAAAEIWTIRAVGFAALVDVSESGSSRKMGDLHKNALAMAARYRDEGVTADPPAPTRTRIRRIERV